MNHFKDLINAAENIEIKGLFALGCWLRDHIDELQVGLLMSAISARLTLNTTPIFRLTASVEQGDHLSIQVYESSNQPPVDIIDVEPTASGYRLLKYSPEQLSLI